MIPESIDDLSVIATNNVPQGGDNVGGTLDDILRAHATIMKRDLALKKAETAEGTSFTPGDDLNSTTVQGAIEEVADLVKSGYVKGMIMMWSGAVDNIPSGWELCNGANGTPDLRGRFVIGAGGDYAVDSTGGGSIPSHSHGVGSLATNSTGAHSHTGTAASGGAHTHTTSSAGGHSHSGTASSAGAHTHSISAQRLVTTGRNNDSALSGAMDQGSWISPSTSSAGAHTHSLSINSAGAHTHTVNSNGAHTHTVSVTSAGAHTHTISGSTAAAGSGSEVIAKYYALCFIMKL